MVYKVYTRKREGPYIVRYGSGVLLGGQFLAGADESMESSGHVRTRLGEFDCGGPWKQTSERYEYGEIPTITGGTWRGTQLRVPMTDFGPSHPAMPTDLTSFGLGGTAVARSIPTAPIWNAVTAMRELRADGVPSVPGIQSWKKRTEVARNSGGEYLNVQFGWLPLVSDIRKLCYAVENSHKILTDYRAGSKKLTRVGYHFPESIAVFDDVRSTLVHHAGLTSNSRSVSANTFASLKKTTWFNGAFRYHLPASDTQLGALDLHLREAQKLLGVKPTPEAIWNSSPWTWGLDWFMNVGDIMTNVSNLGQDGLVMVYGYLMDGAITRQTINVHHGNYGTGSSSPMRGGQVTRIREWKKRVQASPYGFGVSEGSLSATQKAVLVALGLTRLPRR